MDLMIYDLQIIVEFANGNAALVGISVEGFIDFLEIFFCF